MRFSPDGGFLVTAGRDGRIVVRGADDLTELRVHATSEALTRVDVSRAAEWIVGGTESGDALLWSRRSASPTVLAGGRAGLLEVRFDYAGRRVLSAGRDGIARIHRIDRPEQPIVLRGHQGPIFTAHFSDDGARVLTTSADGSARVWRTDGSGEPLVLGSREGGGSAIRDAVFSPDGRRVAVEATDYTVHISRVDWSELVAVLRGSTHACLTAGQRIEFLDEDSDKAQRRWQDCEREHGRTVELPPRQ